MERSFVAIQGEKSEEKSRTGRHASPTYYPLELGPGVRLEVFISTSQVLAISICELEGN